MCSDRMQELFNAYWAQRKRLSQGAPGGQPEEIFVRSVHQRVRSQAAPVSRDRLETIGRVDDIIGSIKVRRALTGADEIGSLHLPLLAGDTLVTGHGDSAVVHFADGTCIKMDQDSILEIVEAHPAVAEGEALNVVALEVGELWANGAVEVHTPAAVVRGKKSEFVVAVKEGDRSFLGVSKGQADFANERGAVRASSNTASSAPPDDGPDPPRDVNIRDLLGWVRPRPRVMFYASQHGLEEDERALKHRLSTAETDADARSRLGVVHRKQGRTEDAVSECMRALRDAPQNAMCEYRLGWVFHPQDQEQALEHLRKAVQLDEDCAPAWALIAALSRDEAALERALGAQPNLVEALVLKALRTREAGATEEAIGLLRAAIQAEPANPLPRDHLAHVLTDLGRLDEAISQCEQALEADPMNASVYCGLGHAFLAGGEPEKAAGAFEKALALPLGGSDPAWQQFFLASLARAHAEMGEDKQAEEEFQRATETDPTFGPVQNEFALFLLERGKDLAVAVEVAKRAVASSPDSHYYRDTLGWAYCKLARLDEALVQLQKARELNDGDPEVHYHLGVVYEARGRRAEAAAAHEAALRILPSFAPSGEALKRLKES